jgi:hypothetical protein
MPNTSPVAIETPRAKRSTRPSSVTDVKRNRKDGSPTPEMRSSRESVSTPHSESRTPATPPASERTTLSVSSCRTMRRRPAPIATRIATSRPRVEARASMSAATLAQAMSRTKVTAPKRTTTERRSAGSTRLSLSGAAAALQTAPLTSIGFSRAICSPTTAISAEASAVPTPVRRRATTSCQ